VIVVKAIDSHWGGGRGRVSAKLLSYSSAAEKCHLTDEHVTTLEWKSP